MARGRPGRRCRYAIHELSATTPWPTWTRPGAPGYRALRTPHGPERKAAGMNVFDRRWRSSRLSRRPSRCGILRPTSRALRCSRPTTTSSSSRSGWASRSRSATPSGAAQEVRHDLDVELVRGGLASVWPGSHLARPRAAKSSATTSSWSPPARSARSPTSMRRRSAAKRTARTARPGPGSRGPVRAPDRLRGSDRSGLVAAAVRTRADDRARATTCRSMTSSSLSSLPRSVRLPSLALGQRRRGGAAGKRRNHV